MGYNLFRAGVAIAYGPLVGYIGQKTIGTAGKQEKKFKILQILHIYIF